jgi:hypothetical protein
MSYYGWTGGLRAGDCTAVVHEYETYDGHVFKQKSECYEFHRPIVYGAYPELFCGYEPGHEYSLRYRPVINRGLDSVDPAYLKCLTQEEYEIAIKSNKQIQDANGNHAEPSKKGKMRTYCDRGWSCPSGSWCCKDPANTSEATNSGRCVYCNDSDSMCNAIFGQQTRSNVCSWAGMVGFPS